MKHKTAHGGHALEVRNAHSTLATYPAHVIGMVARSNANQHEIFDRCIRSSVIQLVRAARVIYPKRLAMPA